MIRIERIHAQPNRYTFSIKPIRELIAEEFTEGNWADPFSGKFSPANFTNDINPEAVAKSHMDALEWLKGLAPKGSFDGVFYDPPYSFTQAAKYGKTEYSNKKYWADCRTELGKLVKPGGKAICLGWNSGGLGKCRGFKMVRVLLVPHGGGRNDTIVTVEVKI